MEDIAQDSTMKGYNIGHYLLTRVTHSLYPLPHFFPFCIKRLPRYFPDVPGLQEGGREGGGRSEPGGQTELALTKNLNSCCLTGVSWPRTRKISWEGRRVTMDFSRGLGIPEVVPEPTQTWRTLNTGRNSECVMVRTLALQYKSETEVRFPGA